MTGAKGIVVFSDLDGTLLDHATYEHAPAEPTLDRLRRAGVPLVLASSKTAAEMVPLRTALGFGHVPLICENGAGMVPGGSRGTAPSQDYANLRRALDSVPGRAHFEGFGDMSAARVAEVTGLSTDAALLARARGFSEPGLWHGDSAGQVDFIRALKDAGIQARSGGRFLTLGAGATKAGRMAEIMRILDGRVSIALGDAPNDAEMIEAADRGIVIRNPHGTPLPPLDGEADGRVRRSRLPGPEGWAETLEPVLTELGCPL